MATKTISRNLTLAEKRSAFFNLVETGSSFEATPEWSANMQDVFAATNDWTDYYLARDERQRGMFQMIAARVLTPEDCRQVFGRIYAAEVTQRVQEQHRKILDEELDDLWAQKQAAVEAETAARDAMRGFVRLQDENRRLAEEVDRLRAHLNAQEECAAKAQERIWQLSNDRDAAQSKLETLTGALKVIGLTPNI